MNTAARSFLPLLALAWSCAGLAADAAPKPRAMAEILAQSAPADWREPDPASTLYVALPAGRAIIELAPAFAPRHAQNIRLLAREHYYDGVFIVRSQDNYVAQWADPDGQRPVKTGQRTLGAEFARPIGPEVALTLLPDGDVYAPEVGFAQGFPAARDPKSGQTWLAHCYGMVGAGRDNAPDSGGGTELYVVNGHAPRHLDRNVTLVGRVLKGIELFTSLPRGTEAMGYYAKPEERVPVRSIRIAADLPQAERTPLEVMRTDTATFRELIESRRNRPEEWFLFKPGRIELCNVPIPVREK